MSSSTFYQDTGQMAAADEDTANALKEWTEERRHWLSTFEQETLYGVARLIMKIGLQVAKGTEE